MSESVWSLYMLRCADGTIYTGISNDVDRRVAKHNAGKGAKYTRPQHRRPAVLVFTQVCGTLSDTMKEECRIKLMSKREKEALIKQFANQQQQRCPQGVPA